MADIRIKDLTTTASSTASDDFIAVDGTTNGTRKLNAFSPTFGGNATVTGTLTVNGSSPSVFRSLFTATRQVEIQIPHTVSTENYLRVASNNGTTFGGDFGYGLTAGGDPEIRFNAVHGGTVTNWLTVRTTTALPSFPKAVSITDTTASTTTSTGALVVSGGVGVAGAIYAGGYASTASHARIGASGSVVALSAANNVDSGLPAAWNGNYGLGVYYSAASTNTILIGDGSAGTTIFATRTGSANTSRITIDNTNGNTTFAGTLTVSGTGTTTIGGTGAVGSPRLFLSGDAGLQIKNATSSRYRVDFYANNVIAKGVLDAYDDTGSAYIPLLISGSRLEVDNTTASTTTSSGALVVSGGVGVAKTISIGDTGSFFNPTSGDAINLKLFGASTTAGATNIIRAWPRGGNAESNATSSIRFYGESGPSAGIKFYSGSGVTETLVATVVHGSTDFRLEGSILTAAPSGGTAAAWKLGTVASISPTSPNRTIEVDIGGTIYYIHAKTTNN